MRHICNKDHVASFITEGKIKNEWRKDCTLPDVYFLPSPKYPTHNLFNNKFASYYPDVPVAFLKGLWLILLQPLVILLKAVASVDYRTISRR